MLIYTRTFFFKYVLKIHKANELWQREALRPLFVRESSEQPLQGIKMPIYQSSADGPRTGAAQSNGAEKLVR